MADFRAGLVCFTGEVVFTYQEYYTTKHWGVTKIRKFKQNKDRRCEACGRKHKNVQVHHKHYDSIGKESMQDLVVVCPDCHTKLHWRVPPLLTKGNNFYEEEFYGVQEVDDVLLALVGY